MKKNSIKNQFSAGFLSLDWMMLLLLALSIRLLRSSLLEIVNSLDGAFLSLCHSLLILLHCLSICLVNPHSEQKERRQYIISWSAQRTPPVVPGIPRQFNYNTKEYLKEEL